MYFFSTPLPLNFFTVSWTKCERHHIKGSHLRLPTAIFPINFPSIVHFPCLVEIERCYVTVTVNLSPCISCLLETLHQIFRSSTHRVKEGPASLKLAPGLCLPLPYLRCEIMFVQFLLSPTMVASVSSMSKENAFLISTHRLGSGKKITGLIYLLAIHWALQMQHKHIVPHLCTYTTAYGAGKQWCGKDNISRTANQQLFLRRVSNIFLTKFWIIQLAHCNFFNPKWLPCTGLLFN